MTNIFEPQGAQQLIERINKLSTSTQPQWGTMSVGQMLAHNNVTYELTYENKHPKPTGLKKWILKTFIKKIVVGDKPFSKNSRTAPAFLITDERDFENEKGRLVDYINKTQKLGTAHFDQRESHSFGKLTISEWNNMFAKHLDHHLRQFGV